MKVEIKKISDNKGEYYVTFEKKEWEKIIKEAETATLNSTKVDGFRDGKAPANLTKGKVSEAQILNLAHQNSLDKAFQYALSKSEDLRPFSRPEVSIKKLSRDEYEVSFVFDLRPEIELGKYVGYDLPARKDEVTEAEIDSQIKAMKEKNALLADKTGDKANVLEKGDIAIFDFEGFKNGKTFQGGSAKNQNLEIGSNQFIPGFEDQMIGMKKGEEKLIVVTFPENYPQVDLANKEVNFQVVLHEIKTKTLPETTEELIKDLNLPDVKTVDELKAQIKASILGQKGVQSRNLLLQELLVKIAKNSKIIVPEQTIEKEAASLRRQFEEELKTKNMSLKDYEKATGLKFDNINAELKKDAENRLKNTLILDQIIAEEKLQVQDVEVEAHLARLSAAYNIPVNTIKQQIKDLNVVRQQLLQEKLFDFLFVKNVKSNKTKTVKPIEKTADTKQEKENSTK